MNNFCFFLLSGFRTGAISSVVIEFSSKHLTLEAKILG